MQSFGQSVLELYSVTRPGDRATEKFENRSVEGEKTPNHYTIVSAPLGIEPNTA